MPKKTSMSENIQTYLKKGRIQKFNLDLPHISPAKKKHLRRFMFEHGAKNGKMLFLPIDHGVEHGPSDFLKNPLAVDPEFQLNLALEGDYSGIVFHIGLAEKYWQKKTYKGKVPLVLKLNGKTNIPPDEEALSPLISTVEDAIKLGADAVGYTLYVGSPRQNEDFTQFLRVRQEAEEAGLPIIMWAYPRGKFAEEKGGRDCLAIVAYAARVADELGADIAKVNAPKPPKQKKYDPEGKLKGYNDLLDLSLAEQMAWVVRCAGSTGVLVSGGSKLGDEDLLNKVRLAVQAGVDGLIFGRNMWQRKYQEALKITKKVKKILKVE
jgi:class I fructose-bisphosphate aldolase